MQQGQHGTGVPPEFLRKQLCRDDQPEWVLKGAGPGCSFGLPEFSIGWASGIPWNYLKAFLRALLALCVHNCQVTLAFANSVPMKVSFFRGLEPWPTKGAQDTSSLLGEALGITQPPKL